MVGCHCDPHMADLGNRQPHNGDCSPNVCIVKLGFKGYGSVFELFFALSFGQTPDNLKLDGRRFAGGISGSLPPCLGIRA